MTRQKVTFTFDDELLSDVSSYARDNTTSVRSLIREFLQKIAAYSDELEKSQLLETNNSYSDREI